MNGFVHTILSFMLSWIRALISNLWSLINSENGGQMFGFLSRSWWQIVLFLFIIGVAVDLIVYFFRWRPDYVWATRLCHLRRKKQRQPVEPEPAPAPVAHTPAPAPNYAMPTQVYAPVQEIGEPVFDEDNVLWEEAAAPLQAEWEAQELPEFGRSQPEPAAYYRDMQAGFAPPVPPQQLYAPSASYQAPVHPGLNEDAFRQSFGLQTDEEALQERAAPVVHAPAFRPFTVVDESVQESKSANPYARFAKRARDLVGMQDDENGPTIRDLQSTVDVSQAFHAPVYPQPMNHDREG